jgi:multicomponent Na+:H+ antiporter subunit C
MNHIGLINYWIAICIILTGLYGVLAKRNLVKQAIALGLFQTGVFLFYVAMGVYEDSSGELASAPIWQAVDGVKVDMPFDNPLPHVLMLTAIVVSVATLAVAVALIVNIKRSYGTIEEDEIAAMEDFA